MFEASRSGVRGQDSASLLTFSLIHSCLPPHPNLFNLELSQLCPPLRALHPPDTAFALEPPRIGSSAGRWRKRNTGASCWSAGTRLQAGKQIYSQFTSVAQSCPTLCNLVDCSTPGLPVHHQIPEFTQTHVHQVGDAIQPCSVVPFSSCPQSLPASESFQMSQFFPSGGQSTGVSASASVLPMNTQD